MTTFPTHSRFSAYHSARRGFTLIELLTVIAIIAVLAAILFPLAGTVREQARASDCMSKLHQLYVSSSVYKLDEGSFPAALLGYAEVADPTGNSTGTYLTDPSSQVPVAMEKLTNAFVYTEQIKDANIYKCPDNPTTRRKPVDSNDIRNVITTAEFPLRPANWPSNPKTGTAYSYIGDTGGNVASICGIGPGGGVLDCFTDGPNKGKPKYYYKWDSFDISPRLDLSGNPVKVNGDYVYERHYSTDWTGTSGKDDMPNQLKYANPPSDRTVLAYCTWHASVARVPTVTMVTLSGTAKKQDLKALLNRGANLVNNAQ